MNRRLLFFLFLLSCRCGFTQDPVFSQFLKTSVFLNPAYTGIDGGLTATVADREQWGRLDKTLPFPGVFSTRFASVEWASSSSKTGIGAFFLSDREGDGKLRTTYAGGSYCYVLPLPTGRRRRSLQNLRLGLGMYYAQKRIDWDRLVFSDQLHPKGPEYFLSASSHAQFFEDFRENPPWWAGLNFGVLWRYIEEKATTGGVQAAVGLNATHILNLVSPNTVESLQGLDTDALATRITLHGSLFFPRWQFGNDEDLFTPIPNFRIDYQGSISVFTLGFDLLFKNLGMGVYYQNTAANTFTRSTEAVILALDMELPFGGRQSLELGLSYDLNVGGLKSFSGGVFELVVRYRLPHSSNRVICPRVSRAHQGRWDNIFYQNQKK